MVVDVTPSFFIDCIGHDGSEIVRPDLAEPFCRRGFHLMECIHVCYNLGFSVTPFDALPQGAINGDYPITVWTNEEAERRITPVLSNECGVITGYTFQKRPHAVAWDRKQIYDPGRVLITEINEIEIETFWCVQSNPRKKNI